MYSYTGFELRLATCRVAPTESYTDAVMPQFGTA